MTAQPELEISDFTWRRVFQTCQWLLILWVCSVFLAAFFAKLMFAMLISVFGGAIALALIGTALFAVSCRSTRGRRWHKIAILLAWPLLVASILSTNWPMKLSFAASRPALDRLAGQIAVGQTPALPTRAGAYLIHAVETRAVNGGQAICLWTLPPIRQHVGFVQSPAGVTPHVNPWTHTQLSPRWHHFAED